MASLNFARFEISFLFILYNNCLLLFVQLNILAQLAAWQGNNAQGPGFDPQVPTFALYCFSLHNQVHMYPLRPPYIISIQPSDHQHARSKAFP